MQLLLSLQQKTNWFTRERCNWLAAVGLAGIVGFGFGNGRTTENSISAISDRLGQKTATVNHLERVVVPNLKAMIPKDIGRGKSESPVHPTPKPSQQVP